MVVPPHPPSPERGPLLLGEAGPSHFNGYASGSGPSSPSCPPPPPSPTDQVHRLPLQDRHPVASAVQLTWDPRVTPLEVCPPPLPSESEDLALGTCFTAPALHPIDTSSGPDSLVPHSTAQLPEPVAPSPLSLRGRQVGIWNRRPTPHRAR